MSSKEIEAIAWGVFVGCGIALIVAPIIWFVEDRLSFDQCVNERPLDSCIDEYRIKRGLEPRED
ncbi:MULTISPECIES: hypothetical protein [unclassified Leptolyngbya]|uniref:hypothetical protein n=1 Tax=unclassified Leptolyngbya TaxID=2650499 RepID=UPI00168907B1|nr:MULTISPECIES: hypothetical protein [unclassified Leptolyngbya]MBD1910896.1 hypothetical protein [Leptolyngbya sp. FACHB-8]MBD2153709.1 hypothetical protein [Leptolyngbya sp. FACHB-16]